MSGEHHEGRQSMMLPQEHGDAHSAEDHGEGNWLVSYADMMTLLVGFFVILLSFSVVDEEKFQEAKKSVSKEFGGKYERPYEDIAKKITDAVNSLGLKDQIGIKTNDKGVDISFLGPVFFATGSADFKEEAKRLLDELIKIFKAEAPDFNYLVEGHTDDVPLAGGGIFRNNWELSSIRACRVLEYFFEKGFAKIQLQAIGFGETRPLVPNRTDKGVAIPENQSQNRRVIIKLMKKDSSAL